MICDRLGFSLERSGLRRGFRGTPEVQTEPGITNQIEQVAYRRCWWQPGERHCRLVRDGNRTHRYRSGSPDDYRLGTAEWYRAMERDGRLKRPGQGR